MITISIINQPVGNRGDQAAHISFVKLIQDAGFRCRVLLTVDPKYSEAFMDKNSSAEYVSIQPFQGITRQMANISLRWPILFRFMGITSAKEYIKHMRQSDLVVCAPGGVCMGAYKSWAHLINMFMAISCNEKVAIWGRSIGPFRTDTKSDRLFRKRSIDILKKVGFISLRDRRSQEILGSMGIPFVPVIDTAFANTPDIPLPIELQYLLNRDYIVFVPNNLTDWHPEFRNVVPECLEKLYIAAMQSILHMGYRVLLLPQLFSCGASGDRHYFQHLKDQISDPGVEVVSDEYDSNVQQAIIRYSTAVVGARYHSIIFAINNLRPFICLSYEHKMHETLRLLGLEMYSLNLKDLAEMGSTEPFLEKLSFLAEHRDTIRSELKAKRDFARRLVREAFDCFVTYAKAR